MWAICELTAVEKREKWFYGVPHKNELTVPKMFIKDGCEKWTCDT